MFGMCRTMRALKRICAPARDPKLTIVETPRRLLGVKLTVVETPRSLLWVSTTARDSKLTIVETSRNPIGGFYYCPRSKVDDSRNLEEDIRGSTLLPEI